ncbi:hypothetical protein Glove_193g40 [Diversispora epigaea]|uniref:Uncharacterized protein n=1 Tax=Diversispora epigaea TaxID=1348612 RepID=A0A397IL85_9GLOM|nr:hypothetical protein Glove_193g40 [Diversispora epigaea]
MVTYYSFGFENNPNPNNEKSPNSSEEETLLTLNCRRTMYSKNLEQLRLEKDPQPQTFERRRKTSGTAPNKWGTHNTTITGSTTNRNYTIGRGHRFSRKLSNKFRKVYFKTGSSVGFRWLVNRRNKKIYIYRRRIDGWNNVNGESVLPGFAIYDKHSSTSQTHENNLLTPVTTHQFASVGDNCKVRFGMRNTSESIKEISDHTHWDSPRD